MRKINSIPAKTSTLYNMTAICNQTGDTNSVKSAFLAQSEKKCLPKLFNNFYVG